MQYDFIAIGDTTTDAFIRLKDAAVHCEVNRERCVICLPFKEKIPYEEVYVVPAVGNSANAAVSAARLGLRSALVANIGGDIAGRECMDVFDREGVSTKLITIHKGAKTNYHYVLWYEDDRTILVKHERYAYALPALGEPRWVYLSSLGEETDGLYDELRAYLATHPAVRFAFQPGTFQIKLGVERMAAFYARADVFFCNREEAQRILKTEEEDVKKLLAGVRALGPKIVVITDGPKGAYVDDGSTSFDSAQDKSLTTGGGEQWFMPPYPDPKPPLERTGAGDAFSSTFTAALAFGLSVVEGLRWAPINSMSVVQQVGARAGLLTRAKLEGYLKHAPPDYQPRSL